MIDNFLKRGAFLEEILPSNAVSIARTSGTNGAWSAWTQITASVNFPFILSGIYSCEVMQVNATTTQQHGIQIGVGGAGSEVTISETNGFCWGYAPFFEGAEVVDITTGHTFFTAPTLIPASSRIAIRTTSSAGSCLGSYYLFGYDATKFDIPLKYLGDPIRYLKGFKIQTKGTSVQPTASKTAVTAGGTAWTYGSWTQIIATTSNPVLITGATITNNTGNPDCQLKIGIGSAGNEIAFSKIAAPARLSFSKGPFCEALLPRPLFVQSGERVAVQTATDTASDIVNVALKTIELL